MGKNTSWESSGSWYQKSVGEAGHYYHRTVVLPGTLKLLGLKAQDSLLDLGCGQGVLSRQIPTNVSYFGVDLSPTLIKEARSQSKNGDHKFLVADVTKSLHLAEPHFSHAAIILALQNMKDPLPVLQNAAKHLKNGGKLLIVINHPCYRIPRQSSWQIDESQKTQYRRIDRYGTSMEIPIATHPGKGSDSPMTLSFHWPLSHLSKSLKAAGFNIEEIDEWYSDKTSTGKNARMENRARSEIPLFMALVCCNNQ